MEIIFIFLLTLSSIFIIFGLVQFIYDKIIKIFNKYRTNKITLNFEQDILFLDYIMSFYIQKELYDFETLNPTIEQIVNSQYKALLSKIVEDITKSLSERYLDKMSNYFDPESLTRYIIQHVDMELTQITLQKNKIKE